MMTFILEMTCECGFIQLSWATYINNEMELLVSLLGRYGISVIFILSAKLVKFNQTSKILLI